MLFDGLTNSESEFQTSKRQQLKSQHEILPWKQTSSENHMNGALGLGAGEGMENKCEGSPEEIVI